MQSNYGKRYSSIKQIAATERRRERTGTRLKVAMKAWAGPLMLVVLFVASLAYVVFGGAYAVEAAVDASALNPALAQKPADAGRAGRRENRPDRSAAPADYFPAAYPDRGRDGEGNVMAYEHD